MSEIATVLAMQEAEATAWGKDKLLILVDMGKGFQQAGVHTPPTLSVSACPHANIFLVIRPARPDSKLLNINSVPKKLSSRITRRELLRRSY